MALGLVLNTDTLLFIRKYYYLKTTLEKVWLKFGSVLVYIKKINQKTMKILFFGFSSFCVVLLKLGF